MSRPHAVSFNSPQASKQGAFANWLKSRAERLKRHRNRLRITVEGYLLLGITVMIGFAAINTGNNLLYMGWGLLLSATLISGVLSEATVRMVHSRLGRGQNMRAREKAYLELEIENKRSRLTAFAIEVVLHAEHESGELTAEAPYILRLNAGQKKAVWAMTIPQHRGRYELKAIETSTYFPFGFFQKRRLYMLPSISTFLVYPHRVDLGRATDALRAYQGQSQISKQGPGQEFFSLRPYREGDDTRMIHWKRTAKTGRVVVRETEIESTHDVLFRLELRHQTPPHLREYALACLGSLAEDIIENGQAAGVHAPGVFVEPNKGGQQRERILSALALLDWDDPLPPARPYAHAVTICVQLQGWSTSPATDHQLSLPPFQEDNKS